MSVSIRDALPDDVDTIAGFNATMAFETENVKLDPATIHGGAKALLEDSSKGRYFLAMVAGEVAGQTMVTYEWSDWRNATIWWIQSVYVKPEFRRRGIFRSLYNHVRELAALENACGLRLYAFHDNHKAHATYKSLGMTSHNIVFEDLFV